MELPAVYSFPDEPYWIVDINSESCRRLDLRLTVNSTIANRPDSVMNCLNSLALGQIPAEPHSWQTNDWTIPGSIQAMPGFMYILLEAKMQSPRFGNYRFIPKHIIITEHIQNYPTMSYQVRNTAGEVYYTYNATDPVNQFTQGMRTSTHSFYMVFPLDVFWDKNHCNELYYGLLELGCEPRTYHMPEMIDGAAVLKIL